MRHTTACACCACHFDTWLACLRYPFWQACGHALAIAPTLLFCDMHLIFTAETHLVPFFRVVKQHSGIPAQLLQTGLPILHCIHGRLEQPQGSWAVAHDLTTPADNKHCLACIWVCDMGSPCTEHCTESTANLLIRGKLYVMVFYFSACIPGFFGRKKRQVRSPCWSLTSAMYVHDLTHDPISIST